jgi:2-oxoisovalerate ferredoxin oxidoreductase alpha subunit
MVKFVKGNEAIVIGALYAGCDAYFGYPITPASEVAHTAALHFPAVGKIFLQAECETASINMLYGAAGAGKLAMTASSGPGISLMQEGISYMAGAELPGLIVNIQRAGPGLGNVYPEQADYNQAVKGGGHGNYNVIVVAPGNVQEMCDLTIKAFELAFKYRNPAFLLSDAILGQMMETMNLPETEWRKPDVSSWAVEATAKTRENLITSIYLNAPEQEKINQKLQAKYEGIQKEALSEGYLTDDAEIVITAYGSSSRVARSAVDELRQRGIKAGLFRPITLFPFPEDQLKEATQGKKLLVVELSSGQYRDDVAFHLGVDRHGISLVNHMGGMLISVEEVVNAAIKLVRGN